MSNAIRNALNEARILILCTQVLLGFHYQSVLAPRFDRLPEALRWLSLGGLAMLILTFVLLAAPAAYHRIVDRGAASPDVQVFTTRALAAALLPLALAFGMATYVMTERIDVGVRPAVAAAAIVGTALGCWYVWPLSTRRPARKEGHAMSERAETPVKDRVEHVLTEIRMVLPGAQALLGFSFAAVLMERFERLPASSQVVHLVGGAFVMLATILLMTPASRHRLVERGADTEQFHRFASRLLLAAMAALGAGVAAQAWVVVRRVSDSVPIATAAAVTSLALCFGVWFGLTLWLRARATADLHAGGSRRRAA